MKLLLTLSVLILLSLISCNLSRDYMGQLGQEHLSCLYASADSAGIDLHTELLKYEQKLIDLQIIQDTTLKSYRQVFESVAENGVFPFPDKLEYVAKGLNPKLITELTSSCSQGARSDFIGTVAIEINDKLEIDKDLKELNHKIEDLAQTEDIDIDDMAELMVLIYQSPYFDQEFLRINALRSFYIYTYPWYSPEEYKIIIDIDENSIIYLNEEEAAPQDLLTKIQELTADLTKEEFENLKVGLRVHRKAKMGIVTDVKLSLREADTRRIEYMSVK